MEFAHVVTTRRMVRNFRADPVPADKLERILDLTQHYPSAGFSQGVAFVIVANAETRKKIGVLQGEEDYYAGRRRFHKWISGAPVVIVACVSEKIYHDRYREPDKLRPDGTEIDWPAPYWFFDVGAACMIILLAAVNEGLAAGFAGIYRTNEIRALLGIPEHFHPVGTISLGYRAKDVPSPSLKRGRKPRKDVIRYEHW
jgi:nitroreductase